MTTLMTIVKLASDLADMPVDDIRANYTIEGLRDVLSTIDELMSDIVDDISYYGEFSERGWDPQFTYYVKGPWDEPDDADIAYVEDGISEWLKLNKAYGFIEDAIAEIS